MRKTTEVIVIQSWLLFSWLRLITTLFEDAATFCSANNKHVGNQTPRSSVRLEEALHRLTRDKCLSQNKKAELRCSTWNAWGAEWTSIQDDTFYHMGERLNLKVV